jgi:Tol biopolymer transport system component
LLPAFSPVGKTLAFVRNLTHDVSDIYLLEVERGRLRQLTFDSRRIRGLAWTPDGKELVFSSNRSGGHKLWRIAAPSGGQPAALEGVGEDAMDPVISGSRGGSVRMAYEYVQEDFNIRVVKLGTDTDGYIPAGASTRAELSPEKSPDGNWLAFTSDRYGFFDIWVCEVDRSSNCRKITAFNSGYVGSPSWSPDSRRIAFDARVNGNADIYVTAVDGGEPVRVTRENSVEVVPNWSADGRWIYFRSDRTRRHEIWKVPAEGGDAIQVTRGGGFEAMESPDGKVLYYVSRRQQGFVDCSCERGCGDPFFWSGIRSPFGLVGKRTGYLFGRFRT